jgi:hypothetical protein
MRLKKTKAGDIERAVSWMQLTANYHPVALFFFSTLKLPPIIAIGDGPGLSNARHWHPL